MSIYEEITSSIRKKRIHMTLIDPAAQGSDRAAVIAEEAEKAGTDYIMIGGSTKVDPAKLKETITRIRARTSRKIIIFPGSASMISDNADAIYFMSLLNSATTEFLIAHQVMAAPVLKRMGIETISMGYLIFEPGMTVGRVGNAQLISRTDSEKAVAYSLAAEMLGMKLVYLESGSGSPTFVSEEVVASVSSSIRIPLIVGGGIRDPVGASKIAEAGADIIVTGTVAEKADRIYDVLKPIISALKAVPVAHPGKI
ncbi:geranylgeranylglyceryl phosphate synthase [uncultured archaeon]|nr:geranylgeranylglyceryl phosphate synthase [uncultured archaeon]HKJ97085.1 geranylgeranylglyceryl/heptaprenylglyceryl phosphate synthase [Thermoplasmataceae archaeon]